MILAKVFLRLFFSSLVIYKVKAYDSSYDDWHWYINRIWKSEPEEIPKVNLIMIG